MEVFLQLSLHFIWLYVIYAYANFSKNNEKESYTELGGGEFEESTLSSVCFV